MSTNEHIFRAYDIRGKYGIDLDEGFAFKLGQSISKAFGPSIKVVVGRDARNGSNLLSISLIQGLTSSGCEVIDLGLVPSPLVYFGTNHLRGDIGVMVTASHLPPDWNGFKLCNSEGIVISEGTGLEVLRKEFFENLKYKNVRGNLKHYPQIIDEYVKHVSSFITIKKTITVVYDYGNSVTSLVLPNLLKHFPINVREINSEVKRGQPERDSEPTVESLQPLKSAVLKFGADIGIAYDGDGDRVALIDGVGNIYTNGNVLIPLLAKYYLEKQKSGNVVFDITCSTSVSDYIRSIGGKPMTTRVGHSYCANEVKRSSALFGGQYSGHFSFPEMNYADDAIFASFRFLEQLSNSKESLLAMVQKIPKRASTEIFEYIVNDTEKFKIVVKLKEELKKKGVEFDETDGLKIYFDRGWILIRASNTSPIIRVNAEADFDERARGLLETGIKFVSTGVFNNDR